MVVMDSGAAAAHCYVALEAHICILCLSHGFEFSASLRVEMNSYSGCWVHVVLRSLTLGCIGRAVPACI